jgi:hypothetical protein
VKTWHDDDWLYVALACLLPLALLLNGCSLEDNSAPAGPPANSSRTTERELTQEEWDRAFEEEQAKIVLPVDPRHRRLELSQGWLAGYWVSGKAACYGSDSGISFQADGTYSEHEEGGRYVIEGNRIRLIVTEVYNAPRSEIGTGGSFTARPIGPNEMETVWSDGAAGPLYRCPPEPLSG